MDGLIGNTVKMILIREKKHYLLYLLTVAFACFGFLFITLKSNGVSLKITLMDHMKPTVSYKGQCYSPDGNKTFRRDRLSKLFVEKFDNKSAFLNESDASKVSYISNNYSTLSDFIENCRSALTSRRLIPGSHSIDMIFHDPPYKDMVRPSCDGLWMEFGVFRGGTLTDIAKWKKKFCGNTSQPIYGFDTFNGLPTNWRPGFERGAFGLPNGTIISVPSNVILVKGLFIDTLPTQLRLIDRQYGCKTPVSFIHIDCDIYDGARDVLFLLGTRFVSGSILVFDELFNYPGYEKHEIKALFELLAGSNLRLIPLGASDTIEINPHQDKVVQSFAFLTESEGVQ